MRSTSFGEIPRTTWTSSSFSAQRHSTDGGIWSADNPNHSDSDSFRSFGKKRHTHSYSDFEYAEEDDIVEIGSRLPDRTYRMGEEDVFGRRRGDFVYSGESMADSEGRPVLACYDDSEEVSSTAQNFPSQSNCNGVISNPSNRADVNGNDSERSHSNLYYSTDDDRDSKNGETSEEEETLRSIAKAIDSSKGRLGKSANMSKAFRAVIRSGDGFVRKSDVIQATLNSNDSKDASMIILLEPDSYDSFSPTPQTEGDQSGTMQKELGSRDPSTYPNGSIRASSLGFSTSMTAKQCAATLETMLREMACKVTRCNGDMESGRCTLRLRVTRAIVGSNAHYEEGGRGKRRSKIDRKMRVIVTIREEDHIRTSVSFAKLGGLYSSRESHEPLCSEIRDRFQREWPAVVEALYIRLPSTRSITSTTNALA